MATIPGAKLFHEGQFEGRRVKLSTFLGRRPQEPIDTERQAFYKKLLTAIHAPVFRQGQWTLCPRSGWPDNSSYQNLGAWSWSNGDDRRLVLVNLSDRAAQARVRVPWDDVGGKVWRLDDALSGSSYDRDGTEIQVEGLYVELAPWDGLILALHVIGDNRNHQPPPSA